MVDISELFFTSKENENFFTVTSTKANTCSVEDLSIKERNGVRITYPVVKLKRSKLVYVDKNQLLVRNLLTKNNILTLPFEKFVEITSLDISDDSLLVAVGKSNGQVILISSIGSKMLTALTVFKGQRISSVVLYKEGKVFVSSQSSIRILNGLERKIDGKIDENSSITVMKIIGDDLVYGTANGEIKFWNIHSQTVEKIYKNIPEELKDFYLLPNEKRFVVLGKDGVYIHNTEYPLDSPKKSSSTHYTEGIIEHSLDGSVILANKFDEFTLYDPMESTNNNKTKEIKSSVPKLELSDDMFDIDESDLAKMKKVTIMTVDDSATMRLIIKNAVEANFDNVEILEAADGVETMKLLKKNPDLDIMFLDWNMPNMNGEEVVDAINQSKAYPNLHIIMATTEGVKAKVRKMVSKGVKGYLVKPFSPESIVEITDKLVKHVRKVK
ncbi:MAG: response regulator [Campylobacterales bacterium]|nr:response regulator [Campylobacterales bacterium]